MKRMIPITLLVLISVSLSVVASQNEQSSREVKHSQFEMLKSLAGSWVELDENGQPTTKRSVFRLTAADSAVMETLFPGTPHEMITMYHLDGDELMLTHYCAMKNQPRMRMVKASKGNSIEFDFVDGTSMKPADAHMHSAIITIIDKNHYSAKWTTHENGESSYVAGFNMVRVTTTYD